MRCPAGWGWRALHVCHVSTAGSVEILRWAKAKGWPVTAEVTPHHLLLTDDLAEDYDPVYKVNPPLRTAADVPFEPKWNHGQVVLEMYERLVEKQTVAPTFYRDFPVEVSPLTRAHRDDPRLAERWDLVAFGAELGTAYSELADPVEQRKRLTEQSLLAAGGAPEAMQLDEAVLRALEYGMPPTGGVGIGIDRIIIMFTGASIRDTVLFPFVKPE